jgi:hypothetical protein
VSQPSLGNGGAVLLRGQHSGRARRRWGTYAVQLPLPMTTDEEAARYLRALLPDLIPRWRQWQANRSEERVLARGAFLAADPGGVRTAAWPIPLEPRRQEGSLSLRRIGGVQIYISRSRQALVLAHRLRLESPPRGPFGGEVVGRLHRQRGRSGRGCRRTCRRHRVESASWGEGECEERRSAIVETALGRFIATLPVARPYLALCTPFLPGVDARRPAGFPFDDGLGLLRWEPEGVGPRVRSRRSCSSSRMSAGASLVSAMASRPSAILSRQSATKSRFAPDQPPSSSDRLLDTASGPFWTSLTGRRTNDRSLW